MAQLANKVALITGGSTGIGRAVALRFGQEGARVTIADINDEDGRATAARVEGKFIHCDTSQPDQTRAAVDQTATTFGGLDILVNCAAYIGNMLSVVEVSEAEWRKVISVTLDGVYHFSKYAVPEMVKRGGGAIVCIASVEGMLGVAGRAAYVAAKSGLFGLVRSMAIDFGKQGVRVNAISPGIIDSGRPDIERYKKDPVVMQFWRDMTVLDRPGRPDEIAAAALFLASDEASYITGHNLVVDGGWTIGHPPIRWPD